MSQPIRDATTGADAAGRILEAARDLFAERGYEGTSIRDIALRAGASKANIFHHYRSKRALYEAVLDEAHARFREEYALLGDRARPLEQSLKAFASTHLQRMLENPGIVNLFLGEVVGRGESQEGASAETLIVAGLESLIDLLETRLDDGRPDPRRDALLLAMVLLGGSYAYFRLDAILEVAAGRDGTIAGLMSADDYARALIDLLLPGLAPAGATRTE
jgi:TetR/AcrR family transcriptional regulator